MTRMRERTMILSFAFSMQREQVLYELSIKRS